VTPAPGRGRSRAGRGRSRAWQGRNSGGSRVRGKAELAGTTMAWLQSEAKHLVRQFSIHAARYSAGGRHGQQGVWGQQGGISRGGSTA
jgi:hypothetical protein